MGAGALLDDDERLQPVASNPAPVTVAPNRTVAGSADEPAAAVAETLLPSVVQLERGGGLGSGVVYDEGLILTAAHVVDGARTVTVRLADGTRLEGEVVGTDAATDVGVIRVDRTGLPVAPLATGVPLRVGQLAVAIGSPFGLDQTVTQGIVSAVNRAVPSEGGSVQGMVQTDAPINPGNSGGALADRQGRVIGINDAIRSRSGGNEGVGFAINIDTAAAVAGQLVRGEPVRAGFLGVGGTEATSGQAGALITELTPGSPAAGAGLRVGDLVTAIDGQPVRSTAELGARVRTLRPGQQTQLDVLRDGQTTRVQLTVGEAPRR